MHVLNQVTKVIINLHNIIIQVVYSKLNVNFSLFENPFIYLDMCRTLFSITLKIKMNDVIILRGIHSLFISLFGNIFSIYVSYHMSPSFYLSLSLSFSHGFLKQCVHSIWDVLWSILVEAHPTYKIWQTKSPRKLTPSNILISLKQVDRYQ